MRILAKYGETKYGESLYGAEKTITANVGVSAQISKGAAFLKTLTANVVISGSFVKSTTKILTAACAVSSSIVRRTLKTLTAGITATGSFTRSTYKTITANVSALGGFGARSIYKTITANVAISGSFTKLINKTLTAALVGILGYIKRYVPVYPTLTYTEYEIDFTLTEYEMALEVFGLPVAGSTITLKGTFPNSAGDLQQLESVSVKVYAPGRILVATLTPGEITTGVYQTDYTIPVSKFGQFDYEFSGILGTKTITGRSSFDSNWR